jgi:hypothetical protein
MILRAVIWILLTAALRAQVPVSGLLLDPSSTPVAGAAVILRQSGGERSVRTSASGEFRFHRVPPGEAELRIEIAGFDPVRRVIHTGRAARPLVVRLKLAARKEEVLVTDRQRELSTGADQNASTVSVERNLLDNLPMLDNNYLSALARFLDPGSPGDAGISLIVDGMEARNVGVTPSAIQEIRINNNPYTAEYPRWSRRRVEIITKSSADRYHGTLNVLFRDHHLNARDALAAERPREQRRILEGSLFGPLAGSRRTSFLLSGAREKEDLVAVVLAQGPDGAIRQNVPTPQVNSVASLRISRQMSESQAMFWQYNFQDRWQQNVGVGGTTVAEAGSQSRFREDELIFNHRGVLTPKLLSQFRILLARYWSPIKSNIPSAKIVVTDAFTGGGAQNDRLTTEVHTSITWLMTQTAGRHTLKYGFNVPDWSRRGLRDEVNRIGTLSYASLADYAASRPFAALAQRGDPKVVFIEKNLGWFLQDEWQVRPGLSLMAGLRYDWQSNFGDANNAAPRMAIAYAPGRSRKWVLRAGAGFFFDRSGPAPVWDILRFDGMHLRRYLLDASSIPADLGSFNGLGLPASIHRLETGMQLPDTMQFSASIERQLTRKSLLAATYTGTRGVQQLRSRDANAPRPPDYSTRPDPSVNVLRILEPAGRLEGNSLEITLRGDVAPRVAGLVQYVFGKALSDTGGLNWFPAASYSPQGEWGRADTDRRHQFNVLGTAALHRWLHLGFSAFVSSGLPFNITTGRDGNRDGMALDRPAGIGRNAGRGPGGAGLDLRWFHEFRFAPARKDKSPSVTVSADAFNLTNRVNFPNYVGAMTSPFFGSAVSSLPARRMQLGLRFQF